MNGKVPGTYVLFTEKPYFSGLQLAVTYKKAKGEKWNGFTPIFAKHSLPNTITKLKSKQNLKVVFYGNSIEAGYNTSNHMNTPPYMPTWAELIVYNLRQHYGPQVSFSNQAVAGTMASWGREQAEAKIIPEKADLVIIGFGMNDGSANISPEKFRLDIDGIIKFVTSQNANAEFILVAPMLPNPDAVQSGIQSMYRFELYKLEKKGIVVADMTTVHSELLKHKIYQDMTGNNVNHPNDYLARWYAQIIFSFLIKKL
ncbi:MAG: SGNH/GDSL hydrolase family protein [Pedobacter sp.]|nr:MAG: SGNH/GDSL hydrolase family protein [Pedobacter sp.]